MGRRANCGRQLHRDSSILYVDLKSCFFSRRSDLRSRQVRRLCGDHTPRIVRRVSPVDRSWLCHQFEPCGRSGNWTDDTTGHNIGSCPPLHFQFTRTALTTLTVQGGALFLGQSDALILECQLVDNTAQVSRGGHYRLLPVRAGFNSYSRRTLFVDAGGWGRSAATGGRYDHSATLDSPSKRCGK
jgi:hypothetical protein